MGRCGGCGQDACAPAPPRSLHTCWRMIICHVVGKAAKGGSGLAGVFGVAGLLHKAQAECLGSKSSNMQVAFLAGCRAHKFSCLHRPPIKPRKQHVVTRSFGYAVSDLFPTADCKAGVWLDERIRVQFDIICKYRLRRFRNLSMSTMPWAAVPSGRF